MTAVIIGISCIVAFLGLAVAGFSAIWWNLFMFQVRASLFLGGLLGVAIGKFIDEA